MIRGRSKKAEDNVRENSVWLIMAFCSKNMKFPLILYAKPIVKQIYLDHTKRRQRESRSGENRRKWIY